MEVYPKSLCNLLSRSLTLFSANPNNQSISRKKTASSTLRKDLDQLLVTLKQTVLLH